MAFSDILAHQKQIMTLKRALERDRLHHAYLFLGPDGVGKNTVALALAAALHCSRMEWDTCGQCHECLRIGDGTHPDVRVVSPEKGKREITIVQMRNLQRMMELRSFSGKKKIAIIDPARLMNYHAQNSLLKTLEDPPGDALIVLIDHSTGNLLSTVLSRCLRLYFPLLPVEQAARILIQRHGWSEEQANVMAAVTGGSVGEALAADPGELLDRRREWIMRFSSLSGGDLRGAMVLAEEVARDREKAVRFLQWVKDWYRDILVQQSGGTEAMINNRDMVDRVREVAPTLSLNHTLGVLSRLEGVARNLQRNYNRRLILEDFFINLVTHSPHGN
jgi:DNA polymerase-3 subunit delta'